MKLKRYNSKNFSIIGDNDIEIEIDKKQIAELYEIIMKDKFVEKVIYYLNEEVQK